MALAAGVVAPSLPDLGLALDLTPILVAAEGLSPRATLLTSLLSIVIAVVVAALHPALSFDWPLRLGVIGVAGVLGYRVAGFREVSRQQERAARLTRLQTDRALKETERLRSFLAQMAEALAQEVPTALTTMVTRADAMRRRTGVTRSQADLRDIQVIEVTARRTLRTGDELLEMLRAGAGGSALKLAPMDLVDTLRKVITQQQAAAANFRFQLESPERVMGEWDQEKIRGLFLSLLSSITKVFPSGSDIRIIVRPGDSEVVVSVFDHHAGVTAAQIESLLRPIALRGRGRPAVAIEATFHISKTLAEVHGGRLWVENQGGASCVLNVALPLPMDD